MKHRFDGRSYNDRIGKPYYGHGLRRIIAPEVTDPSLIERITEAFNEMSARESMFVVGIIALCVFCAALIVVL